ncbi:hypothetical protein VBM87_01175 [Mycoplasma sp. 744]|uniref:hypothetical protein n=1 Tax=Mycoplasma sp. 744 TaxID=3108531 RepID=UPI002B1DE3D0|nr:hypothetical protein [Mycoplasma sp. 744]MEA4115393.1 hypothetical protein [Mycoplasma sp. 744]
MENNKEKISLINSLMGFKNNNTRNVLLLVICCIVLFFFLNWFIFVIIGISIKSLKNDWEDKILALVISLSICIPIITLSTLGIISKTFFILANKEVDELKRHQLYKKAYLTELRYFGYKSAIKKSEEISILKNN